MQISPPKMLLCRLFASLPVTSSLVQLDGAAAAQSRHVSCMRRLWPACSRCSAMIWTGAYQSFRLRDTCIGTGQGGKS